MFATRLEVGDFLPALTLVSVELTLQRSGQKNNLNHLFTESNFLSERIIAARCLAVEGSAMDGTFGAG
jgi:hypothetical protein